MDYPIEHREFEPNEVSLRLGYLGNPVLMAKGIPVKPKNGVHYVQDKHNQEIPVRLKKNLLDPLPQVQIEDETLSLAPPFAWCEFLIFSLPLLLLVYLVGLWGLVLGLIGVYVNSRIFRSGVHPVVGYGVSVLLGMSFVGGAYAFEFIHGPKFLLDEEARKDIQSYIADVEIPLQHNNIPYAIQIDQLDGKKALSEGRHKDAYEIYRKVLAISYGKGNLMGTGIGLGSLAAIFEEMDNHEEALKAAFLNYKVGLAMDAPEEYGVAEMLLGRLMQEKDRDMAMMWRIKAKKSLINTPYVFNYIGLLVDLGKDLAYLGKAVDALNVFKDAWFRVNGLGNGLDQKWVKWQAGYEYANALYWAGQCPQAFSVLNEVMKTFTAEERDQGWYKSLLTIQAACHAQKGQETLAFAGYQQAYSLYDYQRSRALGDYSRAKLDYQNYWLTNEYIKFLLKAHRPYDALALLETNKARTLTDIQQDVSQQGVYEEWATLEKRHTQERMDMSVRQDSLSIWLTSTGSNNRAYRDLLNRQQRERRALQVKLQIREVALSNQLTVVDLRNIQRKLPVDAAVMAMFVSDNQIGVFVMTRDKLQYVPTTLHWTEYRNTINQLRVALQNPYNDFFLEPSQFLYEKLFKPLIPHLNAKVTRLIYSPDDWFSLIPLGVIQNGQHYLIERLTITRVPSLRYFIPERHFSPVRLKGGIACFDPAIEGYRLPFDRDTKKVLQGLYKERVEYLVGKRCSPQKLEKAIAEQSTPTFLHISAHGTFYEPDPMESGMYLSSDDPKKEYEFWDARAMGRLNLNPIQMVTLSSCQTGMKDPRHSRDVFGILRALFFGGAKRVVAPLWSVQDRATAELEQEFYRQFKRSGHPALALQKAQTRLVKHPKFHHPYYWAGFILAEGQL